MAPDPRRLTRLMNVSRRIAPFIMLRKTRFSVSRLALLAVFAVMVSALPASGSASEPSPITPLVNATESYSPQQRQHIRAWAEWWSRELASGEPERVHQGRRRLLDPLRASDVRLLFRETYSTALVEQVRSMIDRQAEIYVLVNALQVVAMLGTETAARLMTDLADPLNEPRSQVRLWAVHGARTIFRDGVIDEGRFPGVLRDLSRAASRESNWMVLQRHFEALSAAGTANARERQIALLEDILDRIERENDESNELIRAVPYAVVAFRDQFLNLATSEQRSFGTDAAPVIGRVFQIASMHWEKAEDADLVESYGGAIQVSETMLGIIDDLVRGVNDGPRTNIGQAWNNRNRQNFQQDSDRWMQVLQQQPYGRGG